jgi:hypothetical protein
MSTGKRVYRLEAHGPADTGMHEMKYDPEDFTSDLPTQTLHEYYNDGDLGMSVGVCKVSVSTFATPLADGIGMGWVLQT